MLHDADVFLRSLLLFLNLPSPSLSMAVYLMMNTFSRQSFLFFYSSLLSRLTFLFPDNFSEILPGF